MDVSAHAAAGAPSGKFDDGKSRIVPTCLNDFERLRSMLINTGQYA